MWQESAFSPASHQSRAGEQTGSYGECIGRWRGQMHWCSMPHALGHWWRWTGSCCHPAPPWGEVPIRKFLWLWTLNPSQVFQKYIQSGFLILESQNYRIVEVGKDLWRSFTFSPTFLLRYGPLQHITQDCDQTAFEYLQGRRLHKPLWATCSSAQ